MLDQGPQEPFPTSPPTSVDPDEVQSPAGATAPPATSIPGRSTAPPAPSTAALMSADLSDAWSRLDQNARLLVGASVAAIVIVLVGLPLSAWDSAPFALLVLVASTFTAVTGWFGASRALRDLPVPRTTIELVATHVVAALALLKAIEIVFDLDVDGVVGLVVGGALLAAATVLLIGAQRRGADPLAFTRGDQWTRVAALGLLLVLVGWAFNLSVSFWTMAQAALPIAVLTIAALTVGEASRISSPIPVAWVGAGIAAFGALLALGNWGDLTRLGRTELVLDVGDYLGLLAYTAGTVLIIVGGVLSGRDTWAASRPGAPGPAAEG